MRLGTPDHELLERILQEDELAGARDGTGLVEVVIEWIRVALAKFFESDAAANIGGVGRTLFLVAVGLLLLWLVRRVAVRLGGVKQAAPDPQDAPRALASPTRHRQHADAARREGDYREAMRHHFLAVLAHLEDGRFVGYGRYKTNREYLSDLAARDAPASLRRAFGALVKAYDTKWYGLLAIDEAGLDQVTAHCEQAIDVAIRGARTPEAA